MSAETKPRTVKELRAEIITFLAGKSDVGLTEIKRHLGMEPMIYSQRLHDALRSKKITIKKAHLQVSEIRGKPVFLGSPISLYSLSS